MQNAIEMTKEQMCKFYGCSIDQLKKQYAANAEGLNRMYEKAKATGKKVNGYTESQLLELVNKYRELAK